MRVSQELDHNQKSMRATMARWKNSRAVNSRGEYLHLDGLSFTRDETYSWIGTRQQFEAVNFVHDGALRRIRTDLVYELPPSDLEQTVLLDEE